MSAPRLAVAPERLGAEPAGAYEWVVHRGAPAVVFLATPLMGLGGGEELDARVSVEPGAAAVVTTQGPTSLLRTERAAAHRWRLEVAAGAHLTHLPWAAVPFAGARASLETHVQLGAGASLVAWELLAAGRVAMGERFRFAELAARYRIAGGEVLLDERFAVAGVDAAPALAGRTHLASLYVAGTAEEALPLARLRELLAGRADLAGASRPHPSLVVVRALDASTERLERALWPLVREARRALGQPELAAAALARRWLD